MSNLKEEFDLFLKNCSIKNDLIDMKIPSLDLEIIENIKFDMKSIVKKLDHFIMPSNSFDICSYLNNIQTIKDISTVKIPINSNHKRILKSISDQFRFRVTSSLTSNVVISGKWNVPATKRSTDFHILSIYEIRTFFHSDERDFDFREFKMIPLNEVKMENNECWLEMGFINLNPKSPIHIAAGNVFIQGHKQLESLKEVCIDKITFPVLNETNYEIIQEKPQSEFKRKCIINTNSLENASLIELLQVRDWQIFERKNIYKNLQMLHINTRGSILLIPLDEIRITLEKLKCAKVLGNVEAIIEIEDTRC